MANLRILGGLAKMVGADNRHKGWKVGTQTLGLTNFTMGNVWVCAAGPTLHREVTEPHFACVRACGLVELLRKRLIYFVGI